MYFTVSCRLQYTSPLNSFTAGILIFSSWRLWLHKRKRERKSKFIVPRFRAQVETNLRLWQGTETFLENPGRTRKYRMLTSLTVSKLSSQSHSVGPTPTFPPSNHLVKRSPAGQEDPRNKQQTAIPEMERWWEKPCCWPRWRILSSEEDNHGW